MKKIAVFASGNGSNFQNLIDAQKVGLLAGRIELIISDRETAYVNTRAQIEGIPIFSFNPKKYLNKEEYELVIVEILQEMKIDYLILAGYMRLIGPILLNAYTNKIVNLHPSLLPSFQGKNAVEQAFNYGVKVTGVTVHFVDEGMDTGPIIKQRAVKIEEHDTLKTLTDKIHQEEHKVLLEAVNLVLSDKVIVDKNRVILKENNYD